MNMHAEKMVYDVGMGVSLVELWCCLTEVLTQNTLQGGGCGGGGVTSCCNLPGVKCCPRKGKLQKWAGGKWG